MSTQSLFLLTAFGMIASISIIGGVAYLVARWLDRKYGTEEG